MQKILIRCDAGNISQIGTGHLARCLTICKYLIKKFKFKKKNFIFLVKTNNKYKIAKEILNTENFNYISLNNKIKDYSTKEISIIKKIKPKLVIIDRLNTINKKFLFSLKKENIRSVLIDDNSRIKNLSDLYFNPLIFKKGKKIFKNQGFDFSIFPSLMIKNKKNNKIIIKKKKIRLFLFFGGFDKKNLQSKIIKILFNNINYELIISEKYKPILKNKIKHYYNRKNFYNKMLISDIAIISGGLVLFDALFLKIPVICIPQYLHQKKNALILQEKKLIHYLGFNQNIEKKLFKLINKLKVNSLLINKMKYYQKKFLLKLKYKYIMKKIKYIYEN
tara:strand:- start:1194 stop:2195 length:1002 start_codon:yes stop_codon:yes gene_type:complete